MPSSGLWPVTVMRLTYEDFKGLSFKANFLSTQQLLFVIRTDFSYEDLIDYVSKTAEYFSIPIDRQEEYLNYAVNKAKDDSNLINWSEKIACLSIGIAVQLSEDLNLCIEPIGEALSEIDRALNFSVRNIKAYRLFDIYQCQ